jgi:hypothetical protein
MRCDLSGFGVGKISTSNPSGLSFEAISSSSLASLPGGFEVYEQVGGW